MKGREASVVSRLLEGSSRWVVFASTFATSSCGYLINDQELRAVGSKQLDCPADKLEVKQITPEFNWYEVKGCKKSEVYTCWRTYEGSQSIKRCGNWPKGPEQEARRVASEVLRCSEDKIKMVALDLKDIPGNTPLEPHQTRLFKATGCGASKKIGCLYRKEPPWPKCVPAK